MFLVIGIDIVYVFGGAVAAVENLIECADPINTPRLVQGLWQRGIDEGG